MSEPQFIAGQRLQSGQYVKIGSDGKIYPCAPEDADAHIPWFQIDQDVNEGETITLVGQLSDREVTTMSGSPLTKKEWAVIHDGGASCDLTYQEAQQMLLALKESGCKGLNVVTNAVGKRAQERGFLTHAGAELTWKTQKSFNA